MECKTARAIILKREKVSKFFGGQEYIIHYQTINLPQTVISSKKVPPLYFSKLIVGDTIDVAVFSADGENWSASAGSAFLDNILGVYIHPSLK